MMTSLTRRRILTKIVAASAAAILGSRSMTFALASQDAPQEHHVEILKFKFNPDKLKVKSGDTIVWTNRDLASHTATAKDKSWDTGAIKKGETKSMHVAAGMSVKYFCRFHPHMNANIDLVSMK